MTPPGWTLTQSGVLGVHADDLKTFWLSMRMNPDDAARLRPLLGSSWSGPGSPVKTLPVGCPSSWRW